MEAWKYFQASDRYLIVQGDVLTDPLEEDWADCHGMYRTWT